MVMSACGNSLSHSFILKPESVPHIHAIEWCLNVYIARSAAFRWWMILGG